MACVTTLGGCQLDRTNLAIESASKPHVWGQRPDLSWEALTRTCQPNRTNLAIEFAIASKPHVEVKSLT